MPSFFDERRLLSGPWQAFERDIARLMVANGFEHVRIIGGSGDRGGDVLGVKKEKLWVIQAKFTANGPPPKEAVIEVVEAGQFYGADRMVVATSRQPGPALLAERDRFARIGVAVEIMGPAQILAALDAAPAYPQSRREPRTYQGDTIERFRSALVETGRGQVVLATGLGKTVVMAETVADLYREERIRDGRVLVLAHTLDLVDQLQRAFWPQLPKSIPTHRLSGTELPSFWDGITFATVQSAASRLDELPPFGLMLVDEAHHVGSDTFTRVVEGVNAPMIGGATATPWRGDGFIIDTVFGEPVARVGIAEGLARGFLSEVDYRLLADNVDWELVQRLSEHGYSLPELNRRLIIPTRDEEAARTIKRAFDVEGRRSGIVFSPTRAHAEHMAAMLRLFGLKTEAILGDTPPRTRDRLLSGFRRGDLDVVASVDLFNEGVDVPDVDLIAFMRVTHSRRIFIQQLGRGLRTSPTKDKVIVLDFVSDLRRVAEVVKLDAEARGFGNEVERLRLSNSILNFRDVSAGGFIHEWLMDQADLLDREGDPQLQLPRFDFPQPMRPGGVQ